MSYEQANGHIGLIWSSPTTMPTMRLWVLAFLRHFSSWDTTLGPYHFFLMKACFL
eukprot:c27607_g1_i1 orf=2-163(-)